MVLDSLVRPLFSFFNFTWRDLISTHRFQEVDYEYGVSVKDAKDMCPGVDSPPFIEFNIVRQKAHDIIYSL